MLDHQDFDDESYFTAIQFETDNCSANYMHILFNRVKDYEGLYYVKVDMDDDETTGVTIAKVADSLKGDVFH